MDQRYVRHDWNRPAERIINLLLPRSVGQMVIAANDVGNFHVVIVDYDGEHVGRRAVGTKQHEVVEIFVLPDDAALNLILDHGFAAQRRLEPDRRLYSSRSFAGVTIAPTAVV